MAQSAPHRVFEVPGRLVADPTDLSQPSPFGGTILGAVRNAAFQLNPRYEEIQAEEYGGQAVEYVRTGEAAALTAILRDYDLDALGKVFPNVATGDFSQKALIAGRVTGSGVVRVGTLASDRSLKLLFAPNDPGNHPAILIYNAIPLVDKASEIQLRLGVEWGVAVVFQATPVATGALYEIGFVKDLHL